MIKQEDDGEKIGWRKNIQLFWKNGYADINYSFNCNKHHRKSSCFHSTTTTTASKHKKMIDRLDAIQRRIFWNKKGFARGGYFCNWDNVSKPIELGGLN